MDSAETRVLRRLSSLAGGVRRRVYRAVAAKHPEAVDRDEVARAVGISRSLAAYHLDRLASDGLIEVSFARRSRRSGPGAGRPAKFYRRSSREMTVSVPARRHQLAAQVLARTVTDVGAGEALAAAGREEGRRIGAHAREGARETGLSEVLSEHGFEPVETEGTIRLRNCPFSPLTSELDSVVCSMTRELVGGIAEELSGKVTVRAEPKPGFCCVVVEKVGDNSAT